MEKISQISIAELRANVFAQLNSMGEAVNCLASYTPFDSKQLHMLKLIERNIYHIYRMINNYCDLSLESPESSQACKEKNDLIGFFKEICNKANEILNTNCNIHIRFKCIYDFKMFVIMFDSKRFENAVLNLLNCSVHLSNRTNRGLVTVKLEDNETEAVITIKNNGDGIPPDYLKRAFEIDSVPISSSLCPDYQKILSLMAARKVLKDMNGKLTFKYRKGSGITFTLILPKEPGFEGAYMREPSKPFVCDKQKMLYYFYDILFPHD